MHQITLRCSKTPCFGDKSLVVDGVRDTSFWFYPTKQAWIWGVLSTSFCPLQRSQLLSISRWVDVANGSHQVGRNALPAGVSCLLGQPHVNLIPLELVIVLPWHENAAQSRRQIWASLMRPLETAQVVLLIFDLVPCRGERPAVSVVVLSAVWMSLLNMTTIKCMFSLL